MKSNNHGSSNYPEIDKGDAIGVFREKQGHVFCGRCCDVRRAVIIFNSVAVGCIGFTTIMAVVGVEMSKGMKFNDDQVNESMGTIQSIPIGPLVAAMFAWITVYLVGIIGAVLYNKWMVGIAAIGYCSNFVLHLIQVNVIGAILVAIAAYPHFYLIKEIHQGIMTKENYPNEKQSCCGCA